MDHRHPILDEDRAVTTMVMILECHRPHQHHCNNNHLNALLLERNARIAKFGELAISILLLMVASSEKVHLEMAIVFSGMLTISNFM